MSARLSLFRSVALVGACAVIAACSRDIGSLGPAPFPNDANVLVDGFPPGMNYQPFGGASLEALSVDNTVRFRGNASIRIDVPGPGSYAGGAFVSTVPRDLREYDALTFWAKASIPNASLNVAGLANDNTGTSKYTTQRNAIPIGTAWRKIVIPIPLSAKLGEESGMFYFAEDAENGAGYTFWIDEVQFETLGTIRNPRPVIASRSVSGEVGGSVSVTGTAVTFDVDGVDVSVDAAPGYFTFLSSDEAVAAPSDTGGVRVVGAGTATITARLGETAASGSIALTAFGPPTTAAADPTRDAADVISLFSGAYTNVPVTTFSAGFDNADVADVTIAGNAIKRYTNLVFAGIEFTSPLVDASQMTHLHVDVYTTDASRFLLRLVDFGANGIFAGNDDSQGQVILSSSTSPSLTPGAWTSLDIPLSAFGGLQNRAHLAQIILENASPTLYLDNLYFYKAATPPPPPVAEAPTEAAPAPTRPASNVISLFSDAYSNVPVDTWRTGWSDGQVDETVTAGGNAVKKYFGVNFVGVEFVGGNSIDATGMTHFAMDLWTPDPTSGDAAFRFVVVDAGPDGDITTTGDNKEHVTFVRATTTPALGTGQWIHIEVPFSAMPNLTTRAHLSQLVFAGLGTFFVDNVYFFNDAAPPTAPITAAPAPTFAASDVISLFSDAYTNVPVDTWRTSWSNGQIDESVTAGGNAVKKYFGVDFVGVEFLGGNSIDATGMTHFSMDIWTAEAPSGADGAFRFVVVDAGADNTVAPNGDDKQHTTFINATSTPAIGVGRWIHIDVPFSAMPDLTTRGNLSQLVFAGVGTFYIDNVILHK